MNDSGSAPAPHEAEGAGAADRDSQSPHSGAAGAVQKEAVARIGPVSSLTDIPAVAEYLREQGAEPINFRTARVVEFKDGYPATTGRITFREDGAVEVSGSAEAPDEARATLIQDAFKRVDLPKHVSLTALAELPPGVVLSDPSVFVCHDFTGRVVLIHQRYETQDGGKGFAPWTRWSDGQWRKMEPEVMPFFGLPGHETCSTLFVHEGAKAASRVKALIDAKDGSRFPWYEEMKRGHHLGWLGGVHAIERSDWPALAALGWKRVVIVADNDRHGLRAALRIARFFPANVFILSFDQRFEDGHDCGDEWPESLFDDAGCYTGPSMRDCMLPATRATLVLPAEGRGRPTVILRPEFAATVAYTVEPLRFIFRHHASRDRSPDEFNALAAPFSDVKNTATKVLGQIECQHDRMIYHPAFDPGTVFMDGARCFNVYDPPSLMPSDGDAAPWLDYLAHLIPDPDERAEVLRWIATLIARPDIRMRYGLLLISITQGVGKNTLANILKRMLGAANVSFPSERSVVESQFNGWLARKRLVFIAEIYSGSSRKAYDNLKGVLADDDCEVNEKHVKQYRLDNWATVIACSNSEAALHLDDEDRRWYVPAVAETLKPPEWWEGLYSWIEGEGPGIILRWAEQYVATHGYVRTGDHAPGSKRKRTIAEASRSEGQSLSISFAEFIVAADRRIILRLSDVRRWIAARRGFHDLADRRLERVTTIIAAMRKVQGITVWADNLRPKFGATREAVVMNFTPNAEARWADIKEHLTKVEGVIPDEPM
jgi:Family of unknown function (DUF5906)